MKVLIDEEDLDRLLGVANEWSEDQIDLWKCTPNEDMTDEDREAENHAYEIESLVGGLMEETKIEGVPKTDLKGGWVETERYIDKCIGALDEVMDWVDPLDGEVVEIPVPVGVKFQDAGDRRREALGDALEQVAECITSLCTECDALVEEMDDAQLAHHRTYRGMVLIACEGYWVINPRALGLEGHENWSDAYETGDEG